MREIKLRYVFSRKSDRHIYIIGLDIEGVEQEHGELRAARKNGLWELIARDQFTGLKDKNGTEIYEGDILVAEMLDLYDEHVQITIAWDDGGWWGAIVTDLLEVDRDESHLPRAEELSGFDPVRVIGNIHENPELLP